MPSREIIQQLFIRICRDSKFTLDMHRVTSLTADILKISPIQIWAAFSSLDDMQKIAMGTHPYLQI